MKRKVDLADGREVIIVGTQHVSQESIDEVRSVIESESPDLVGVELDEDRLSSLKGSSKWTDVDLVEAVKSGQGYLLAANIFLMIYQRKLGLEEGVKPGQELLNAVEVAEENKIEVALLDRNINDTFRRAYDNLSIFERLKLLTALIPTRTHGELDLEENLLQEDILDALVKELNDEFPTIGEVFLDERNSYMAEKLLEKDFDTAVMVVGAAHVKGIEEDLREGKTHSEREIRKIPVLKYAKYGFPALILGLMALGFVRGGFQQLLELGAIWIATNCIMSGLGAVLAKSHKKTWVTATLAAPFTSMTPVIGAGIVAAYVEARYHPPTVEEMEAVTEITDYKTLMDNQVGRILATLVLVSVLGGIATFLAAGLISLTFL